MRSPDPGSATWPYHIDLQNHKNNSEAIWELPFDGYSAGDQVGNWAPSIWVGGSTDNYEGGGWKKFNTPSNDLVSAFSFLKMTRFGSTIP